MKGYRLLGDIREEFKVSYQTLDKHLIKLNITKKTIDRRVYIKNNEYDILYKSLSNSNRVKRITEIDHNESKIKTEEDKLLKKEIALLEKRIVELENDIAFKNKEIESFHITMQNDNLKLKKLEGEVKLLEEEKDLEIKTITEELDNTIKAKCKLELSIKFLNKSIEEKEKDNEKLKNEIIEERVAKEIIIAENDKYKNMSFINRFKFLLFNK